MPDQPTRWDNAFHLIVRSPVTDEEVESDVVLE
jgi:hypothetical protein